MGRIKCKIIGNQIWTAENLTKEQYYIITGRNIPVKNDNWIGYDGAKCYGYESNFTTKKKQYLFDIRAVEYLHSFSNEHHTWRIPTLNDLDILFQNIDGRSNTDFINNEIAISLRGTYGWINNGSNKIGFNALPNPTLNENCELSEQEISRWWLYNDRRDEFEGFSLYQEDVVAFCGIHEINAFAIRLVMDLQNPRIEDNIIYI
jgi:uncharacterized protein (TIGR02145 family)